MTEKNEEDPQEKTLVQAKIMALIMRAKSNDLVKGRNPNII